VTYIPESYASAVGYKQYIQRYFDLLHHGFSLSVRKKLSTTALSQQFPLLLILHRISSPSIVSGRAFLHIEVLYPNDALIVVMGWVVCYVRPFAMNESPSSSAYVDPSPPTLFLEYRSKVVAKYNHPSYIRNIADPL
jgi:hypothetical protein